MIYKKCKIKLLTLCFIALLAPVLLEGFPFDLLKIKAHIDHKFKEAKVELDPFPHIIISEILPPDLYSYLVSQWPEEAAFDKNSPLRRRLPVTQGCAENRPLTPEQCDAWKTFGEIVVHQFIQDNIKNHLIGLSGYKFSFVQQHQLQKIIENITFDHAFSDGLNLDYCGFSINPHVDQSYIFSSILIYFPPDNQHADYGTVLYRNPQTSRDIRYVNFEECKIAKKVPFLPNTMLAYLQTPNGWHGVEPITEKNYLRKSYLSLLNLKYEMVEEVYGADVYKSKDLYTAEHRYLNPRNFDPR